MPTIWLLIFDFMDVGIPGSGQRVGYKILLKENLIKASVIITNRSKQYPVLGFLLLNCLCRCELIGFEVHHEYHFAMNPARSNYESLRVSDIKRESQRKYSHAEERAIDN